MLSHYLFSRVTYSAHNFLTGSYFQPIPFHRVSRYRFNRVQCSANTFFCRVPYSARNFFTGSYSQPVPFHRVSQYLFLFKQGPMLSQYILSRVPYSARNFLTGSYSQPVPFQRVRKTTGSFLKCTTCLLACLCTKKVKMTSTTNRKEYQLHL